MFPTPTFLRQAQITQSATNTNTAMPMAGRRLRHLKQMRTSLQRNLRRLHHYNNSRRRKRSVKSCAGGGGGDEDFKNKNISQRSTPDTCCDFSLDCNGDECKNNNSSAHHQSSPSGSCEGHSEGDIMVDEAVLAAAALVDMWKELVAEEDPRIMARHACRTASALAATSSRLAAMMGDVGVAAAAHTLANVQVCVSRKALIF